MNLENKLNALRGKLDKKALNEQMSSETQLYFDNVKRCEPHLIEAVHAFCKFIRENIPKGFWVEEFDNIFVPIIQTPEEIISFKIVTNLNTGIWGNSYSTNMLNLCHQAAQISVTKPPNIILLSEDVIDDLLEKIIKKVLIKNELI